MASISQAMHKQLLAWGDGRPAGSSASASPRRHVTSLLVSATSATALSCREMMKKGPPASSSAAYEGKIEREAMVVTHSMPAEKIGMFKELESWAETSLLPFLKPVEKSWQPQDLLPDASGSTEAFVEEIKELRMRAQGLPQEYLVCLVGDMITEEALPTYHSFLNSLDGVLDETGASPSPWARWIRSWTAEENRHGDLLNKYLYLTGRVDMHSIENTIHYLIASGMDLKTENNPYLGFIYTSFQERATFIAHGNTARQAKQFGDVKLAHICGTIAADERRHEKAYQKIVEKLFEIDPNETMLCLEDMMKKRIGMPAQLMYDGCDAGLFHNFSRLAQTTGVYTTKDYVAILQHLLQRWNVEKLSGLSSRGQQAQEYVCTLPARLNKLEERAQCRMNKTPPSTSPFSWIFNQEVNLVSKTIVFS